ncbi:hypothetical protein [Synechococcus sp. CB0101]|uniref:hypothetical protein n=1 Tax=Synechococcus sp. CB0101 TaxID=232348 RepID=UPI001FEDD64A|nr:hypothetical protein [Synechococcus sp. CB0101]
MLETLPAMLQLLLKTSAVGNTGECIHKRRCGQQTILALKGIPLTLVLPLHPEQQQRNHSNDD